ncbi:alpha/beta hydrolase [Alysiella crassa]|uniref:Lysophospholipase L2 n=1 Tax=Alysiella crassa TaxID=153491 RepID=A0A376BMN1_9NEIS|nr:alpha/beta hydrolase [Alysiella crassa]UOP06832.1 lysophospholipase [Alysiella crassa]SSY71042.1 lysophospholipase L2 [Alysiella crassa]
MKTLLKSTALALALSLSFGSVATAKTPEQPVKLSITKSTAQKIKTLDGLNLHLQKDIPNAKPKAVVVISHGLASHSGVFGDFAKTMNANDIAVYRFDHRGHGKSDGRDSIHINSYFEMVEDLRLVVQKAKAEHPNTPVFVLGHSMGGHISALYGTKYPHDVNGFILAAGVLRYNTMNFGHLPRPEPKDSFVDGSVSLTTLNIPFEGAGLSVGGDPLMLNKFSVSFPNSFKEGIKYLKDNDDKFVAPVMLISGNKDVFVAPKDAIDFYNETNSVDKSLILYPNFGHLLMLENGGQKINDDVAEWINERVK